MASALGSPPRLVIFDVDGTLTDSVGFIADCVARALEELGAPIPSRQSLVPTIGADMEDSLRSLLGDAMPPMEKIVERYRVHAFGPDRERTVLYDGVRHTLQTLQKAGLTLAAATGKGRRGLQHTFESHNLDRYFTTTRTADVTRSKPHPMMLEEILEELFCEPTDAVMVGDTTFDIDMAHAAGMRSVAVTYGGHPRTTLAESAPTTFIDRMPDLLPLILPPTP